MAKVGAFKELGAGVAAGAIGSALANQIPQNQKPSRIGRLVNHEEKKHKGKVKKAMAPVSDDPYFNHEAARKIFDLIMKMDDDTAQVFCHVVASDLLEREVEENRVTLQKHLDEVIDQRKADVSKAMARMVIKGEIEPEAYAEAWDLIETQISKADDEIPNWEFERKIKRDKTTGRFQIKFSDRALDKPMPDKTAKAMGITGTTGRNYTSLSRKDKARYQSQYLQIARYLEAVNAATDGDNKTLIHFHDDDTGENWAEEATSTKPPTTMLPKNIRAVGAETQPNALTVGGAAFSVAGAMGHSMSPQAVAGFNAADAGSAAFRESWIKDTGGANSNARLYERTGALGQMAYDIAPSGSKVQLAGKMAQIVGQYGPQAEVVIGPGARKTAYRYRGTEKTPDDRLVNDYAKAVEEGKRRGPRDIWAEREELRVSRMRGERPGPFGDATGVRAKGTYRRTLKPEETPSLQQMVATREARANRAPDWKEREEGRAAVAQYLTERLPSKKNYKLQLASGTTPPSEGVIINAAGQLTTQAVGYGDDHYLPFNLKNLKDLKGGEYIRNRSVGGLTSEDVYTGLISGARRVTVVSRSGTFTMEFEPDFRGGRRHNDKARRMTRRYEQILDAVQSEQVERQDIPTRWKKIIEDEVRGEYGPSASPRLVRAEIDNRQKEFKANPQIDGRDLDRAEASITQMENREKRGEVSRQDVADYRKELMTELRDLKEIHFRLNGVGYAAALDSLQEQFPYYIHTASKPKEEHLEEFERDLGYVEPARNRPTAASAGWYGTAGKEHSGKFSAAHADYQRGLPGAPEPGRRPGSKGVPVETAATASTSSGGGASYRSESEVARDKAAEALERLQSQSQVKAKALELQQTIKRMPTPPGEAPPWWDMDAGQMSAYLDDDKNLKTFDDWVQGRASNLENSDAGRQWQAYANAQRSSGGGKDYDSSRALTWDISPYKFPKDPAGAYRSSPEPGAVEAEIRKIDGMDASLAFDKPLSALDPKELRAEFDLSHDLTKVMQSTKLSGDGAQAALGNKVRNAGSGYASLFFAPGGAERHLENIHKMRYLKAKGGPGLSPGGSVGGATGNPGSGAGGTGGVWAGIPGQPAGGGHLQRTPEADKAALDQVEEVRQKWVAAADRVLKHSTSTDESNELSAFTAGMASARGFKDHDKWLDDLSEETRKKVEDSLSGNYR